MSQKENCHGDDRKINHVLRKIDSDSVLQAANSLIKAGKNLPQFPNSCMYITDKKQSFRFYPTKGTYPFSFIVNQNSLLFYLQRNAVNSNLYKSHILQSKFNDMRKEDGRWIIRIINEIDASFVIDKILTKWK